MIYLSLLAFTVYLELPIAKGEKGDGCGLLYAAGAADASISNDLPRKDRFLAYNLKSQLVSFPIGLLSAQLYQE